LKNDGGAQVAEPSFDAAIGAPFVPSRKYSFPCSLVESSKSAVDGGTRETVTVYEHDENGRMTSSRIGEVRTDYFYDEEGRLIRTEESNRSSPDQTDVAVASTTNYF
jgi:hypothetical protein